MNNDDEENTNVVIDNGLVDKCNLNLNNRIEFFKVKEKILSDTLDSMDKDLDNIDIVSMTDNEIESIIVKEQNKQMNDDEIIDYLLKNDVKDNNNQVAKNAINNISLKLEKYLERKNKKLETIQEKIKEERNKEFTFMPNGGNKKKKLRTFEEFIRSQREHIEKVKEKIKFLRMQLESDDQSNYHNIPVIDNNSKKIFARNQNQNVYDRLYNSKKVQNELLTNSKSTKSIQSCKSSFISKSKEEYLNNLYSDAQKRQDKLREKQIEMENELYSLRPKSSMNSNKILYNKFKNQFQNEVNTLLYDDCVSISYRDFIALLKRINFINEDNTNMNLINQIYNSLSYENPSKKINIDHLFIFCLAVLGLLNYYILSSYIGTTTNSTDNTIATIKEIDLDTTLSQINNELTPKITKNRFFGGFDENKNYIITPTQAKYIFNECKCLYYNWKNKDNSMKQRSKSPIYSLMPTTKSMKSLKTEGNLFIHINQSLNRKKALEKEILDLKIAKEKSELDNCTFKPSINRKTPFNNDIISLTSFETKLNQSVNEILYQRGTMMNLTRSNRDIREIEYEKQMNECTFHPKINERKIIYSNIKFNNGKEEEKYLERCKNGRMEREYKNSFLNFRNYDHFSQNGRNKSVGKLRVNTDNILNKKKLIIAIDVAITKGLKKKLFVYQGDQAETLAKNFAQENSKLFNNFIFYRFKRKERSKIKFINSKGNK